MANAEYLIKGFPLTIQNDNELHPDGSCNLTSATNCMKFFNCKRDLRYSQYLQFEDEVMARSEDNGLDRHEPATIKKMLELYGLNDVLTIAESWQDSGRAVYALIEHLKKGWPGIVHTYLTSGGHIVCVDGVRMTEGKPVQWHIADSNGEWYPQGYQKNWGGDKDLGRYWMSHNAFTAKVLTDGIFWCHLVSSAIAQKAA
jgi:Peptidase_C39 like family